MRAAPHAAEPVARSLTLLRVFLLASGVILLAGALILSSALTGALRRQAVEDEKDDVAMFAGSVLTPALREGDRLVVDLPRMLELSDAIRFPTEVRSVKVWAPDGTLMFASLDPERAGRQFEVGEDLARTLATERPQGELARVSEEVESGETGSQALAGLEHVLDVYAPILGESGSAIGAFEVYLDPSQLDAVIAEARRTVWLTVLAVFAALYLALALLVRGASGRLRAQTSELRRSSDELLASYRRLEQSSLEAIELLTATVDAKDPYTAGHSQRVRLIALAVGEELGLPAERVELLGTAALFHDVGKIAVPDAILTKRGRLDPAELAVVREHAARGAEIVAKLSTLADAVPWIRHHHERLDGTGYPDGLAGDEIPLEAAVLGLADAWDAMTTERPYAAALPIAEAFRELRDGRGGQFHPRVVDAFLAVARSGRIDAVRHVASARAPVRLSA